MEERDQPVPEGPQKLDQLSELERQRSPQRDWVEEPEEGESGALPPPDEQD